MYIYTYEYPITYTRHGYCVTRLTWTPKSSSQALHKVLYLGPLESMRRKQVLNGLLTHKWFSVIWVQGQ